MRARPPILLWRPGVIPVGKKDGKDPSVWLVAQRWHTYEGKSIDEGDFYLVHEDMVETIEQVLKWSRRDTPPPRAAHTATTIRVTA